MIVSFVNYCVISELENIRSLESRSFSSPDLKRFIGSYRILKCKNLNIFNDKKPFMYRTDILLY